MSGFLSGVSTLVTILIKLVVLAGLVGFLTLVVFWLYALADLAEAST